jgi:hypothetical protein
MSACSFSHAYSTMTIKWSCLLALLIQFVTSSLSSAVEIRWREEFVAQIDGRSVDCAFTGGMEFCKPSFIDIDLDGDFDMCMGGKDGMLHFFANEGNSHDPRWEFSTVIFDSSIGERSCPAFADIDHDNDLDLFVGNREGRICFFRNDGTSNSPFWVLISEYYDSIDVGPESIPRLIDIDADLDLDLFVGKDDGKLSFYCNVGNREIPVWDLVSDYYDSIDVGSRSTPAFGDLDADGDFDLLIGEEEGNINYFKNTGDKSSPGWEPITENYNAIFVGKRSSPVLVDIDSDSDLDLFVGQCEGRISYFRNDGSVFLPSWTPVTEDYLFLDVGAHSAPALVDIDADEDFDLFVGEEQGNINFYGNQGTLRISSWNTATESYFAIEANKCSSPTFADIDADDDPDMFIGRKDGKLDFYENIGIEQSALWNWIPDRYDFIDVGGYSSPTFVDIDGDDDLDMFLGQIYGKIYFYQNDGTPELPLWMQTSENFESIDVGWYSTPTFGDLDSDGDYDLLVGNDKGRIHFYRNQGTPGAFSFAFVNDFFDSIDVGDRSKPFLCDFDSDGDLDLFVGESQGGLHHYKNQTLNSVRGKVTDDQGSPENVLVYLSGDKQDSTYTDSSGSYKFVGLPVGYYCVYREAGSFQYCFNPLESDTFEINFLGVTHVDELSQQSNRAQFQLFPNYPNPFNPLTNFLYYLPTGSKIELAIYNLRGEKVKELAGGFRPKGWEKAVWDGSDSHGRKVASGIYFCSLQTDKGTQTIKMVLLK